MPDPIKFYTWPTPNGKKVAIMLEECNLRYEVEPVNIMAGDQHESKFHKLNINEKIPVIIDPAGPGGRAISIMESGAILIYLAEKTGKFMPTEGRARSRVIQWLMWQMAGFGPMLGQAHHFRNYAPDRIDYGIERYTKEAQRLYGVLNERLSKVPFVGGQRYSIADMAIYPWAVPSQMQGVDIGKFEHVSRWLETMSESPAVHRGMNFMIDYETRSSKLDEDARRALFGS